MGTPPFGKPAGEAVATPERRGSLDPRREPTPMLSRFSFRGGTRSGERRGGRRGGENRGTFVDSYGSRLFALVTVVAALNILDAFFTVLFLSYGGYELNPIVRACLDNGIWCFIVLKSIGIGLCLGFLTVTKNFWFSRFGLGLILLGYVLLLGWHLHLYGGLPQA